MAKKQIKKVAGKPKRQCLFVLPPNFDPRIPQGFYWVGYPDSNGFKEAFAFHKAHSMEPGILSSESKEK
jgi:hypothetical protein